MHREREREIHNVHWASKAYEDESVFMSEAHLGWQRQNQTGPSGSGARSSCAWNHGHLAVDQHNERGYHQRRKEVCHAHDSQNWLIRIKSSALVTDFVLAEGTHQTRCLFGERERERFTTSIQPAMAYEDESVLGLGLCADAYDTSRITVSAYLFLKEVIPNQATVTPFQQLQIRQKYQGLDASMCHCSA